ncbi:MAG: hypothetical protein J5803_02035 [Desulfovibrio sp.]|nr:hypothetical protein [Desulfovibrio sp.]
MVEESGLSKELETLLQDAAIADNLKEKAYEETSPQIRVALKAGIALNYQYYGAERPSYSKIQLQKEHAGYGFTTIQKPLDWTVLFLNDSYDAAARFLAALMLPRLCFVPTVLVFFEGPPPPVLLTALELAGIETCYQGTGTLFEESISLLQGKGRILSFTSSLPKSIQEHPSLTILENTPPSVTVLEPSCFSRDLLTAMHGNVPFTQAIERETDTLFASHKTNERLLQEKKDVPRLLLSPGCEGFWIHSTLFPELFYDKQLASYPIESDFLF